MKFTIIGAGAIGGITGGHLVRAGHEVTFVEAAEEHLAAIREHGLTLEGLSDFTVRPAAVVRPGELRAPLGTVLCAVKTLHTSAALAPAAPLLAREEVVVSMQNGLAYRDVVDAVGAERTLVACFNFGGHYESPGRVVHGTKGGFHIGVFFATALVDADVPEILGRDRYQTLMADLVAETATAADALGVRLIELHGFDPDSLRSDRRTAAATRRALDSIARSFNPLQQRTGIWIDLAVRKRKTEAEPQLGRLISEAGRRGVMMPLNRAVFELITEMEQGRRSFAWENLDEVERRGRELSAARG